MFSTAKTGAGIMLVGTYAALEQELELEESCSVIFSRVGLGDKPP